MHGLIRCSKSLGKLPGALSKVFTKAFPPDGQMNASFSSFSISPGQIKLACVLLANDPKLE